MVQHGPGGQGGIKHPRWTVELEGKAPGGDHPDGLSLTPICQEAVKPKGTPGSSGHALNKSEASGQCHGVRVDPSAPTSMEGSSRGMQMAVQDVEVDEDETSGGGRCPA